MKHIVCYSGGHSSALVAIEVVRKFGKENVILLNHNISSKVEHQDIKRFKQEVANYLGIKITNADHENYEEYTPLRIARELKGFQFSPGKALCTYNLKTKPFYDWLGKNCKDKQNYTIYYGFDSDEENRIENKVIKMRSMGYAVDFPLAYWKRTIENIEEVGINRPITYRIFKHCNCFPCLKAGKQHYFMLFCLRRDVFNEAIETEEYIGHSIIKGTYLKDLIPLYEEMITKGICPNDRENSATFWARVNNTLPEQMSFLPCDCAFL